MSSFASPRAALVCLDLQRGRQGGPFASADLACCRRVLAEARTRRWPVLHVHDRTLVDPRPISGLEPRPSEPVFLRQGPSAFSNPNFRRAAHALGGPLALIGYSLGDTVLATAFAAADRGLPVEVVGDAVCLGAGAEALFASLRGLGPRVRLVPADELLDQTEDRFVAANAP